MRKLVGAAVPRSAPFTFHKRRREIFSSLLKETDKTFIGLIGQRGVGKTVLFRQLISEFNNSFYISIDTLTEEISLYDLIKELNERYSLETFFLDEIHFASNPEAELKKIYDFLNVKIFFTSSVALKMHESVYDLARRVRTYQIYPFSFREYLNFTKGSDLEKISVEQIVENNFDKAILLHEKEFHNYLSGELMPFSLDNDKVLEILENTVETIIQRDIPRVASIKFEEAQSIKKLLAFIGKSEVDGMNPSSIAKNIGITKYKAEQYLSFLERSFLVIHVAPLGTNVLREPKILLSPPYRLLYRDYESAIGGLREDFFVWALKQSALNFQYIKDFRGKKTPDYYISKEVSDLAKDLVLEIGGINKSTKQLKGLSEEYYKLVFRHGGRSEGESRNLIVLGFL